MLGDIEEIIPSAGRLKFLPGGPARCGYIPDPNINAKCLEDCVVVNHTLKEMTQDIMLHCEKLRYTSRCYVPTLISRSPKLPLVFLELYGNTGNVLYFLSIS